VKKTLNLAQEKADLNFASKDLGVTLYECSALMKEGLRESIEAILFMAIKTPPQKPVQQELPPPVRPDVPVSRPPPPLPPPPRRG
jgi:hypothetical protein